MPILQDKNVILGFPESDCDFDKDGCPNEFDPGKPLIEQEYWDRNRILRELIWVTFRFGSDLLPDNTTSNTNTSGMYYLYTEVYRHMIETTVSNDGHHVPVNSLGEPLFELSSGSTGDLIINSNGMRQPVSTNYLGDVTIMNNFLPVLKSPLITNEILKTIRPTILCEAASIFAYYYLNYILCNYSGIGIDITKSDKELIFQKNLGNTDESNKNQPKHYIHKLYKSSYNYDAGNFHPVIGCLKRKLLRLGLKQSSLNDSSVFIAIHHTFGPIGSVGVSFYNTKSSNFPKFADDEYDNAGERAYPFAFVKENYIDKVGKNRLYYFIDFLRFGFPLEDFRGSAKVVITESERPPIVKNDIVDEILADEILNKLLREKLGLYYKAQEFAEAYEQVYYNYVQHLIKCFYEQIGEDQVPPAAALLATGDGSGTLGLLNIPNAGVTTFAYGYTNDKLSRVSPTQSRYFSVNTDKNEVIHFNSLGFDFDPEKSEFIIRDRDNVLDIKFVANKTLKVFTPEITETVTFIQDSLIPDKYYFYETGTTSEGRKLIGTYYKNFRDFQFEPDGEKKIEIILKSAYIANNLPSEFEELQVLFNIVPVPKFDNLVISLNDLFSNDKFEATIDKIGSILNSENDRDFISKFITSILEEPSLIINTNLNGNFVGVTYDQLPNLPLVKSDSNYIPDSDSISEENDPTSDIAYSKLRYSFGSLVYVSPTEININISSWVSPRVSNLDLKINTEDYRNGMTIPSGAPSAFPIGTTANTIDSLNDFTNGYLIPTYNKLSYNQPLAMLRSFGLLEAFCLKVKYLALEKLNQGEITNSDFNTVKSKLASILNNSFCSDKSGDSRGIPSAPWQLTSIMTYSNYFNFKWYRLNSIKYDDLNNAVKVGGTYVIIPGQFEYNEFDHETW
jgi:hypothetical protein